MGLTKGRKRRPPPLMEEEILDWRDRKRSDREQRRIRRIERREYVEGLKERKASRYLIFLPTKKEDSEKRVAWG